MEHVVQGLRLHVTEHRLQANHPGPAPGEEEHLLKEIKSDIDRLRYVKKKFKMEQIELIDILSQLRKVCFK